MITAVSKTDENASLSSRPSLENIFPIEDHNQAYHIWRSWGIKNKTLVHIDAHLDFAWFPEKNPLELLELKSLSELHQTLENTEIWNPSTDPEDTKPDIGNYIYPAIKEGMVKTFYWVVPDNFLNTKRKLRYFKRGMIETIKKIPQDKQQVFLKNRSILTKFYDCEVIVCSLNDLPQFSDSVLLDIDVDFLLTDFETGKSVALLQHKRKLPWIWPEELVKKLKVKGITSDLITIAYSVEKYFTPLEFKYLGDNLKILLSGGIVNRQIKTAIEYRDTALREKYQGHLDTAAEYLEKAIQLIPQDPANHYNLACIQYENGRFDLARASYQKAVSLDKSYRSRYNNLGKLYYQLNLKDKMRQEYEKLLLLDPDNSYAHSGIGEVWFIERKISAAKKEFQIALELEPKNQRARHLLATILILEKKYAEAIEILEALVSENPGHLQAYLDLGNVYQKQGFFDRAISNYKSAVRLGAYSSLLYLNFGRLYLEKKLFRKAFKSYLKFLHLFPFELVIYIKNYFARERLLREIFH